MPYKPSTVLISFLTTCYFVVVFNHLVISTIADAHGFKKLADYMFMLTALVFLGTLINLVISLFAFKYIFKPWIIFLVIGSTVTSYYMETYHIWIDSHMIQNVVETDYGEVKGLFSARLAMQLILFGVFPSLLVIRIPIHYQPLFVEIIRKGFVAAGSCVSIGVISLLYYQDYASLFRNNHHLRDQIIPIDYIYAGYSYARSSLFVPSGTLEKLGEDAKPGPSWKSGKKMTVMVIAVGETARAANFSLGGYSRETNPVLKQQDIFYFPAFYSCGTATAVSVPCMFSNMGKRNYDNVVVKHRENLLDVISHAGLSVLWRDNNSGCKGVCDRVDYEDLSHANNPQLCNSEECFDEVLLDDLEQRIHDYHNSGHNGLVIVMHQHGSHGPAYFQRVPSAFEKFKPLCHTNQLQECTREEITNAYDNTILYTDYTLSRIIDFLKKHERDYDSSLLYLSDHGESLGENNLYLHGLPYSIAPDEQRHIPALFWMSHGFSSRFHINPACLAQHNTDIYSHDNLFHSVLGLLNIETSAYSSLLDLFYPCRIKS